MADIVVDPTAVYYSAEPMILGLQWYIWGFLALVLALMFTAAAFIFYWWKMGPCGDYFGAARRNQDLGFLAMKSGRAKFIAMDYIAGVFNAIKIPLSWIQRSPDSFRFGEINAKIFMDQWGIATDPKIQQAVKVIVEEWNDEHITQDGIPYDQITDYRSLMDKIIKGQIDDPVIIPAVCEVPLYEIERYLPKIKAADFEAHVAERVSEEIADRTGTGLPGWVKLFIIAQLGIVALCIGGYIILNGA
ncbi:MAG: hypothetical protein WC489_07305 [Patescibacteria group bacterium]|jgi:hypothetical protein|nr:hypothetical protein [Methanoregulaceae archaeon]